MDYYEANELKMVADAVVDAMAIGMQRHRTENWEYMYVEDDGPSILMKKDGKFYRMKIERAEVAPLPL